MLACGHDQIDKLQGLVRSQPMAVVTFAVAGVSLIGLPPSGGFIAKWLLLNAAIDFAAPIKAQKVSSGMALCGFALAISAVLLGFNAEWILNLLGDNDVPTLIGTGGAP